MREKLWTGENIELLRKLWADGETAAAIAFRLGGLSRSAVLGQVFRLRRRGENAAAAIAVKETSVGQIGDAITAPARRRRRQPRHRAQPADCVVSQHKTLFQLTNNTCRWPHGRPGTNKFFFCGAPEADLERGIPYCARHMCRAYPGYTAIDQIDSGTRGRRFSPLAMST
jgi:GcrA cell cycle regulator